MQFKLLTALPASKNYLQVVIMRTFILLFCATIFGFTPKNGFSQDANVIVKSDRKVSIETIFELIRKQTNYTFIYSDNILKNIPKISLKKGKIKASILLNKGLNPANYTYTFDNNIIVVTKKAQPKSTVQKSFIIKGTVKDEKGSPIIGATVYLTTSKNKKSLKATATDFDGKFRLKAALGLNLVVSYIGYQTYTQKITTRQKDYTIVLKEAINKIKDVVVTGIVTRKKESFTGAAQTYTGKELKAIGNLNVLQSLKTLDPSFVFKQDGLSNAIGSDPNAIAPVRIRGGSGTTTLSTLEDRFGNSTDPNQPLFILDGFESNIKIIKDLDMNRVASLTILKDAASTALYGARAANGVVVITTVKPKMGKLRVSYTQDVILEFPDLSDYNMMNAAQKLRYEKLSRVYKDENDIYGYKKDIFTDDALYNKRLTEVRRGVDTYWLSLPLQEGVTVGQSLSASGGSEAIRYGIGLNYRDLQGVMKGSGRKTWGANLNLTYNKGKLRVSNTLYLSGYHPEQSPYGYFSTYVNLNPYLRKTNISEDNPQEYLDSDEYKKIVNPFYDASLSSYDKAQNFNLRNTTAVIWTLDSHFRVNANLFLTKNTLTKKKFIDPESIRFDNVEFLKKGSYADTRSENFNYSFNIMATYAIVFLKKHRVTANLRGEVSSDEREGFAVDLQGFQEGTNGDPRFAFGYSENRKPYTNYTLSRKVNALASINYGFDNTYFLDATYRIDGSTAFGSNKKFHPFWSVGLGWNLSRQFKINPKKISLLKLRGNIGITANQNFRGATETALYSYGSQTNTFGNSVDLQTLGSPDLQWQSTLNLSVGVDATLFNNRLNITLNAYRNKTDPLVVTGDLPPSTGVPSYPTNAGYLKTEGLEAIVSFSPIRNLEKRIVWSLNLNASTQKSVYGDFGEVLNSLDKEAKSSKYYSLRRYTDGHSPDDLWLVPSLGIDPSYGRDVFLNRDGAPTYDFNPKDERVMGTNQPKVQGVIGSNLRIKGFSIAVNLRFSLGRDVLNYALFNKVENIARFKGGLSNQDLRALTADRWEKPGDIARFKNIVGASRKIGNTNKWIPENISEISSRFLQKENVISGESLRLGYEFLNKSWMEKIGINRLQMSVFMNDIFSLSTIKSERGINYPFSRKISFSLNLSF